MNEEKDILEEDGERWHESWKEGSTPWASDEADGLLMKHFSSLSLATDSTAFVPLCGNSISTRWLYDQGLHVTAIDLVPEAIENLITLRFPEISFTKSQEGSFELHSAERIALYTGSIFDFSKRDCFDLIYDRAALIALPTVTLPQYRDVLLTALKPEGSIFTETIEYDQSKKDPPPHSVKDAEFKALYEKSDVNLIEDRPIEEISERFLDLGITWIQRRAYLVKHPKA